MLDPEEASSPSCMRGASRQTRSIPSCSGIFLASDMYCNVSSVRNSHAHWDHCRPIRDVFPNAIALFGPGTKESCSPGHMANPDIQWDGRFFDPERATERWDELHGPWVPFGPFERALDYFGDGSFWIMQAPGHMAGNLCAAARLQSGEWVLLGSDCCHSR